MFSFTPHLYDYILIFMNFLTPVDQALNMILQVVMEKLLLNKFPTSFASFLFYSCSGGVLGRLTTY